MADKFFVYSVENESGRNEVCLVKDKESFECILKSRRENHFEETVHTGVLDMSPIGLGYVVWDVLANKEMLKAIEISDRIRAAWINKYAVTALLDNSQCIVRAVSRKLIEAKIEHFVIEVQIRLRNVPKSFYHWQIQLKENNDSIILDPSCWYKQDDVTETIEKTSILGF